MRTPVSQLVWNLKSFYYRWLRRFFAYKWIYRREIRPFHIWLEGQFPPEKRYLDLAAGSGDSLVLFPRNTRVVALDFSSKMLALLREKRPIPVVQGRAESLPFKTASFFGITAIGLTEYVTSAEELLSEVHRILVPGGWFAVTFSQSNFLNLLRNLSGNRIHTHTLSDFSRTAQNSGFRLHASHKTLFQTQVLLRRD